MAVLLLAEVGAEGDGLGWGWGLARIGVLMEIVRLWLRWMGCGSGIDFFFFFFGVC